VAFVLANGCVLVEEGWLIHRRRRVVRAQARVDEEALMIGRYETISSHVASPACEKECRNVLLPAFWSPRS
jgi:hypothetical protein